MAAEETDRDKLAAMMLRVGLATGHGDTIDDLLAELEAQIVALQVKVERTHKIDYTRGIEAWNTLGIL